MNHEASWVFRLKPVGLPLTSRPDDYRRPVHANPASLADSSQIVQVAWCTTPEYLHKNCSRISDPCLGKVANHQQASHDEHVWRVPVEDPRLEAPMPYVGLFLSSTSQDLHQAVLFSHVFLACSVRFCNVRCSVRRIDSKFCRQCMLSTVKAVTSCWFAGCRRVDAPRNRACCIFSCHGPGIQEQFSPYVTCP